ncbi:DUF4365 domain-containing protein [Bradyrhizobium sp. NBAIM20]|uniref:DUF4365 domain-containing protein n=1 Tax=unclassified Bradyrhizobium TaxID=2631580 RepID=UPI001CD2F117|nr:MULTISPECIES: DUF4365 domain-containing protein [unclassified Bradyrhizobium]MCA1411679.1 DUF4365 domain-containing protein [Bradyrhizobium sp. NBAIM20]MCA1460986.1 DUF4365 domain-containing protein [Bradyrhizobium sp. NBAIM18]
MTKTVSDNQLLGELGETAVKKIVLETGFIYEQRGRLEAGVDGLIELRDPKSGAALGKLLGVQVKATAEGKYIRESDKSFEYTLKSKDLGYWRKYNIPVIIVLWRQSDGSAYWQDVSSGLRGDERRLKFDKADDVFDPSCADRLAAITIDRRAPGVHIPPLNFGESARWRLMCWRGLTLPYRACLGFELSRNPFDDVYVCCSRRSAPKYLHLPRIVGLAFGKLTGRAKELDPGLRGCPGG